ncbi:alpha-N-acetylgalactosaminide alpha-2,6-sialyltransferase 6 isoform X2 [Aquila chrysaetos chrysaetos]|uniref:alpha-N-acetylgalactosaminide alpha-2,6-sialyltransferase 6 isoform X2 n=1 Tax=Aquila chrysaetos chrysaetos TaxID=223781 RepID=UPI00117696D6|nr:alpha-N-acetylgalactosaminide alpha-2,6-sialyltransferase 6 isoform X2 [Aquila chrysaetos chrysaetos]
MEPPPCPTKSPREGPWAARLARKRPRHPNNVALCPAPGQAPRAAPGTGGQRCRFPPPTSATRTGALGVGTGQAAGAGATVSCPVGARRGEDGARTPAGAPHPGRAALGPPRALPGPGRRAAPGAPCARGGGPGPGGQQRRRRQAASRRTAERSVDPVLSLRARLAGAGEGTAPWPAGGAVPAPRLRDVTPGESPWPCSPEGPGSPPQPTGRRRRGRTPPRRSQPATDESPPPSSGSGSEVFPYSRLRGRARRPPDLKKWGVKSGYLPVCGNKTLTARCHQCVIVTSSSHLLGTHLGTAIDGAECTIRMNDAPTTGYEVDVGNKTSFRVVAHSSLYRVLKRPQEFVNKTPETIFIFWGPPAKMQKSLLKIIQRVSASFPNMTAYVVSPGRMKQFDDLFRGETGKDREKSRSWLSTGWFTMVIAVELCDAVHVYGMVPPNYCGRRPPPRRLPYHYYEPKGPDECTTYIHNERSRKGNHHRFITEKRVFASWAGLYNITFSHPTWP